MKSTIDALQMAASVWVAVGLGVLSFVWTVVFFGGIAVDAWRLLRNRRRYDRTKTIN